MLYAHANTTSVDFIVQLRTYVIAMGLSQAVVDCVDALAGADQTEAEHAKELQRTEDVTVVATKTEILEAVRVWLDDKDLFSDTVKESLLAAVIEAV